MSRAQSLAVVLFSIGMVGLGTLSVIYRDFAYDWQPVPAFHPGRGALAVACGMFMIVASIALLLRPTRTIAAQALFPFVLAWTCLKTPALIVAPSIEGVWLGFGEIGMLLAGGWVLFASSPAKEGAAFFRHITGQRGLRIAQVVFGLAVIPVGLGHIFYVNITASLVPPWLPFRIAIAYLTGVVQIACGLGILFSVLPRAAALIESGMLALFAFLVWGPDAWIAPSPRLQGTPSGARFPLTAFFITWVIGASALLIATSIASQRNSQISDPHKPV